MKIKTPPKPKRKYNSNVVKGWSIFIEHDEDWDILSNILAQKGYKFESGYTFSKHNPITSYKPFKIEYFDNDQKYADSEDMGYAYAMNGGDGFKDGFVLLSRPNNKLNMVQKLTFDSRKKSTYKNYTIYETLMDIIPEL